MAWTRSADPRRIFAAVPERNRQTPALRRGHVGMYGLDAEDRAWVELMAKMSHDMRTPLNAVIGFADLLQQEMYGDLGHQRYREYVDHIRHSGAELLKAAEQTLLMTALATSPTSPDEAFCLATVTAVVESAVAASAAASGIALEFDVPLDIRVRADRRATRQALKSLVCAAISAADDDARITVRGAADHGTARLDIELQPVACDANGTCLTSDGRNELTLAHALLHYQGCKLVERELRPAGWSATVLMEQMAQPDFFGSF